MTELKKHIYDETNGLWYERKGDYYIPMIRLSEDERPIGKWGRLHRDYIREHRPVLYDSLVLDGTRWTYLADLNEQAQNRLEVINDQMKAAEGVTEDHEVQKLIARNKEKLRCKRLAFSVLCLSSAAVPVNQSFCNHAFQNSTGRCLADIQ